jgi:SAM-dependent methyltransferase
MVLAGPGAGGEEIEAGLLRCTACPASFQIIDSVPRFVSSGNYARSFGFQWNRFRQTQLDSHTGTTITRDRFARQTGWDPAALSGAAVLDAGCGSGRFAEIALSFGARVFAVDYSTAAEAAWRNLGSHPNMNVVQADIYSLPFRRDAFDYVYCFGVLQHTPSPRRAFSALAEKLRPGGRIAVDVYHKTWRALLAPRYWLRPLTTRLSNPTLFRLTERAVPLLLPLSRAVTRLPWVGGPASRLIPVANYENIYPLTARQLDEWAVLDTFDMLSPAYDKPQSARALRSWLTRAGLEDVEVVRMGALVGRGRKPAPKGG